MDKPKSKRNPVARYGRRFNRAAVFRDRSKYARKSKHKNAEPFALAV